MSIYILGFPKPVGKEANVSCQDVNFCKLIFCSDFNISLGQMQLYLWQSQYWFAEAPLLLPWLQLVIVSTHSSGLVLIYSSQTEMNVVNTRLVCVMHQTLPLQ